MFTALNRRCVTVECSVLSLCIFDAQPCLAENIPELGPFPPAVHHGRLSPIYYIDLLYKLWYQNGHLNMGDLLRNVLRGSTCK